MPPTIALVLACVLIAWLSALAIGWSRLQRDIARLRAAHVERLADAARREREQDPSAR